jgi:ABC-type Fe3+/spermidine/putrescine transport system ATPase subunit
VSISLRPHHIRITLGAEASAALVREGLQCYPGTILQGVYFGDVMDYQVELGRNIVLRVITPATDRLEPGQPVNVFVHPQHCVIVARDASP